MAVKIRLTRKGKKKQPTYRVIVADSRSPRDGRYIEQIGRYDPRQEPSLVEIDNERAAYWLKRGAQPSDAVRKLLEISGALEARPVKAGSAVHVVAVEAQQAATDEEPADDAAPDASEAPAGESPVAEAAAEEGPATGEVHVVGEEAQLEAEAADEDADAAEPASAENGDEEHS